MAKNTSLVDLAMAGPTVLGNQGSIVDLIPSSKFVNAKLGLVDTEVQDVASKLAVYRMTLEGGSEADLPRLYEENVGQLQQMAIPDMKTRLEEYRTRYVAQLQTDMLNVIAEEGGDPSDPRSISENVQGRLADVQDIKSLDELYRQSFTDNEVMVDELGGSTGDTNFDEIIKAEAATKQFMWDKFKELIPPDDSIWDYIGSGVDFAAMVLPDFTKDLKDLYGPNTSLWKTGQALKSEITFFQSLSPAQKRVFLSERIPEIIEAFDGNSFKIGAVLGLYYDPDFAFEINLMQGLEAADVGTMGWSVLVSGPVRVIKNIRAGLSLRKRLAEMNRPDLAVAVGEAEKASARATGQTRYAEAATANPFRLPFVDDMGANTTAEHQRIVAMRKLLAEERAKELMELEVDQLGPVVDTAKVQARVTRELKEEVTNAGEIFDSITEFKMGDRSVSVTYKVNGTDRTKRISYTLDDVGVWNVEGHDTQKALAMYAGYIADPQSMFSVLDGNLVNTLTYAGDQSSRLVKILQPMIRKIDEGLSINGKGRRAVDQALLNGDYRGKVWTIDELTSGAVELYDGTRHVFTPDEVILYYRMRDFYDQMGVMQNHMVRQNLQLRGARNLKWPGAKAGESNQVLGSPVDLDTLSALDQDAFIYAPFQLGTDKNVPKYRKVKTITEWMKTNELPKGMKLYKLEEPRFKVKFTKNEKGEQVKGREKIEYILMPVDGKDFKDLPLPAKVVHFTTGYVPAKYNRGYYYVKDTAGERYVTKRVFTTRQEAMDWATEQNEIRKANGEPGELAVFADGDMTEMESRLETLRLQGGRLFTSPRASERPTLGREGTPPGRATAFESTELYLESIAHNLPLNEYRATTIQKFMNTVNARAKQLDPVRYKDGAFLDRNDWQSPIDLPGADGAYFKHLQEYLRVSLTAQSVDESKWTNVMLNLSQHLEGKSNYEVLSYLKTKTRNAALWLADTNPVSALKGAAFHAHLGFFNARQLWVQTQNAAIAALSSPMALVEGAFGNSLALRSLALIPKDSTAEAAAKEIYKLAGGVMRGFKDEAEFVDTVLAFRRSGILDSTLRQADYFNAISGVSNGTLGTAKKFLESGTVFFKEGEIMARTLSWSIARQNVLKNNPGLKGKELARAVSDETRRIMMNMQSQNAAYWQRGVLGVPFQFLQVQAKFMQSVIGGLLMGRKGGAQWSRGEASRIAAGQLFLYGTIGVPFTAGLREYLLDFTGDEDPEALNQKVAAIESGIIGSLAYNLGIDADFSSGVNLLGGMDDNVIWKVMSSIGDQYASKVDVAAAALGASGSMLTGVNNAFDRAVLMSRVMWEKPDIETFASESLGVVQTLARTISSFDNALQEYYLLDMEGAYSKSGRLTIQAQEFEERGQMELRDRIARALGMTTNLETRYYELKKTNMQSERNKRQVLDAMLGAWREFRTKSDPTPHDWQILNIQFGVLLKPYSEYGRIQMNKMFYERLENPTSPLEREMQLYLRNLIENGKFKEPGGVDTPIFGVDKE